MVERPLYIDRIRRTFQVHPVAALLGPRQCGKTTLARIVAAHEPTTYFDLEDPADRARLANPIQALGPLKGLVVIDELQRQPGLFEVLRVLVDRPDSEVRFLVLGSVSPSLIKGVTETLAGRVGFIDMGGFGLGEVGEGELSRLWVRGGFPRAFLAADDEASLAWRAGFVRTFLERDIPQLGITVPAETLRRFWTMTAHYHGQVWNAAEFARSLGSAESTARRYLDILSGAYMLRVLPPWFENLAKRQVKAPKTYLRDSGVLHALLQVDSLHALLGHPKLGASWEGFALEQILVLLDTEDAYYWATHAGAELDLFARIGGKRYGFEFKYTDAPRTTRSMHIAISDLRLDHLWVVHPGTKSWPADERITMCPLGEMVSIVRAFAGFRGSDLSRA
ncbi:MAG: ATP-binding protein [Acidobacteriota bacterium]